MIRVMPVNENISKIEIKLHLPHESIFAFLQKRGYETKPWLYEYEDETFPNGKTLHEHWTFTATKKGEDQSEESLFSIVFENEFKELLKELSIG